MAKIKGINIELGGDAAGLNKAISEVNSNVRSTQSELNYLDKQLKLDPTSTVLLAQKQKKLAEQIEQTESKVKILKTAKESADAAMASGTEVNQKQYDKLVVELEVAKISVEKLKSSANQTETALNGMADEASGEMDDLAESTESAEGKAKNAANGGFTVLKGALANLVSEGISKAIAAIKNFMSDGLDLASDLQEVQNVVDTTFGDSAQSIYDFANTASEQFGLTKLEAEQYSGSLGAALKASGLGDHAAEMSTTLAGLSGDLASFYNLSADEAYEKVFAGVISGETEPLKSLGVVMSETNLNAYAMSQGITTAYSSMTSAEKAQLRYNYLLSVTSDAQGDFSKTSDSYANQQKILEMNMDNVSATLGEKLLPVLNDVMKSFNDWIQSDQGQQFLNGLSTAISGVANGIASVISFIQTHQALVLAILGAVTLAVTAFTIAQLVANAAIFPVMLIIMGIIAAIALLAIGIVELIKHFDWVKQTASDCWNAIQSAFATAADWFKNKVVTPIGNFFSNLWSGIKYGGAMAFWALESGVLTMANFVIGAINKMISFALTPVNLAISGINMIPGVDIPTIEFTIPSFTLPSMPEKPTFLANGGVLSSGSAVVGEAGAELLTMIGGKAQVTPLTSGQKSSALAGLSGITISIANFVNNDTNTDINKLTDVIADKLQKKVNRRIAANA